MNRRPGADAEVGNWIALPGVMLAAMTHFCRLFVGACLTTFAGAAAAGTTPVAPSSPDLQTARPPGWLMVTPGYTHQFETDLDSDDLSFSADRWRLDLGTRLPLTEALTVAVGTEAEWSLYDFEGTASVASGLADDADRLFVGQLGGMATYELNDTWQILLGGSISWGGDFDASFSDGLGGSVLLGATYRFSPRFSLTPGVLALARLEDDALVIPVIGMDWQITDSWRLRSIGPGAELAWSAHEEWTLFLRGLYRPRDFRLAPEAAVPSGVLRERAFPLTAGVEWSPSSRVTATAFGGAVVGGTLRLSDSGGDEVFEEDTDVTPIVGGSLRILF